MCPLPMGSPLPSGTENLYLPASVGNTMVPPSPSPLGLMVAYQHQQTNPMMAVATSLWGSQLARWWEIS